MNSVSMSKRTESLAGAGDLLASPALSLSLAGIFKNGGEAACGGGSREETADASSENSAPGKSRSEDDCEMVDGEQPNADEEAEAEAEAEAENNGGEKGKKRKKHQRHTPEQIRQLEALFKASPHPDEKQRLWLSKELGLHPRQVKFWFQNRRTQVKTIQERHEKSLLKSEIDLLRDENKALREAMTTIACPKCGFSASGDDQVGDGDEQKLRIENLMLKAEVQKLMLINQKYCNGTPSKGSSFLNGCSGRYRGEKLHLKDSVDRAMEELRKMATQGEPLWVRSHETGREILNYDEYVKVFCVEGSDAMEQKKSIEASRDSRIIFVDLPWLVKSFMDANQWKELFPCLISKAETVGVICNGEGENRDGAVLLMCAEIQMLTSMVPARELYFIRSCKQLEPNKWAILDVSVENVEDNIDMSIQKCRKRPSGCIIEDKSNGHCKVTWVEHVECQKSAIHSLYRAIVNRGLAFGAKHWISTLQQECERLVFLVATNVPIKDSCGVAMVAAGRKSILKLAQRMTSSFCKAVGASSSNSWNKITSKTGDDIRVASRKNLNDSGGEPLGTIVSAISSIWLPVTHHALFDFLRDEKLRNEWDIMSKGSTIQLIVNLAKGQDRGNAVAALATESDKQRWLLQDSSTNASNSMVVYSPVDIKGMESVMTGCDSSNIPILPSGFSILADGIESRPFLITSRPDDKSTEGGSLLTIALQILISNPYTGKLSKDTLDSISTLISCTLQNIKRSLQCEEG